MLSHGAGAGGQSRVIPTGNRTICAESSTVSCQELPAGLYGINVLHGVAGGAPVGGGRVACTDMGMECTGGTTCLDGRCQVPAALSSTGGDLAGGTFSGQAWTVPNPLGDSSQIDDPVAEQGIASLFVVQDPNPGGPVGRTDGRSGCDQAPDPAIMGIHDIEFRDFSEYGEEAEAARASCCGPGEHLCGVPLCPEASLEGGLGIRGSATTVTDDGLPNCLPFLIPAPCCP